MGDLDLEETHVSALIRALEHEKATDGWTNLVDLLPLFFHLTLDTATEFLFGESTNSQTLLMGAISPEGDDALTFAKAFDRSQLLIARTVPLGSFYWLGHTPEFKRLVGHVNRFASRFVQIALDYRANPEACDAKYGDKYIFLHALAKETQDPDELRAEVLNVLLAGRDTTASLLSWFFYTIAAKENSQYYQRLRAVILEEFGTRSSTKSITFEKLKTCQYLQWCINETLRLYPVVPMNVRTAMTDTSLPVGGGPDGTSPIYVKKGQDVYFSVCWTFFGLDPAELLFCRAWLIANSSRFMSCIVGRISGAQTQTSSGQTGGRAGNIRGAIYRSTEVLEFASGSSLR